MVIHNRVRRFEIFQMCPSPIHLTAQQGKQNLSCINIRKMDFFDRSTSISLKTTQYIRDQLVRLTEQFSSITLRSTDRILRHIYMQSLNTFIIEKRNLTELVMEMANYTNRAIMKKLEAIRNLVTISEQSYRKFAESDNDTRDATAKYMLVS